jgi:hypothetical protein
MYISLYKMCEINFYPIKIQLVDPFFSAIFGSRFRVLKITLGPPNHYHVHTSGRIFIKFSQIGNNSSNSATKSNQTHDSIQSEK